MTRTPPLQQNDYTEVQPSPRTGHYVVIALGPHLGRLTLHETDDLVEANTIAVRLAGIMQSWHATSAP